MRLSRLQARMSGVAIAATLAAPPARMWPSVNRRASSVGVTISPSVRLAFRVGVSERTVLTFESGEP
jgi:hypothetical protein